MNAVPDAIGFVGFGEAASAFARGWGTMGPRLFAYDIKTDAPSEEARRGKWADYVAAKVDGCETLDLALSRADAIFSLVTPDQALVAATRAAPHVRQDAFFFDCNSCSPETKRKAGEHIGRGGGRYVDVSIMAPVHPLLHRTPLLVSGPHAAAALPFLSALGMDAKIVSTEIGGASAVKMIRSVLVKGLEALVVECLVAGDRAGATDAVLDSLDASFPGFDWRMRSRYMLERAAVHGTRRAAELDEANATLDALGVDAMMTRAARNWEQLVGGLSVAAKDGDTARDMAHAIACGLYDRQSASGRAA